MPKKNERKSSTSELETKLENNMKEDVITKPSSEILIEINDDKFTSKNFCSSKKVLDNIVIDLKKQTIKIPEVDPIEPESIYHQSVSKISYAFILFYALTLI